MREENSKLGGLIQASKAQSQAFINLQAIKGELKALVD